MRKLLALAVLALLLAPASADAAVCTGTVCTVDKVGPFMQNISAACGNAGDCSLVDIMTVIKNVGNFALGIVGSLVLLMYVMGGYWWIVSHGDPGLVTKGKEYLRNATIGLVIVFVAFAAINSLVFLIQGREPGSPPQFQQ